MRGLMLVGLLIYGIAHPAAMHGLWHLLGLAGGALARAGSDHAVAQDLGSLLGSHWH